MKLKKVIQQLSSKDYKKIVDQFKATNGEKYIILLAMYRKNAMSENEVLNQLNISTAAYYTLRSRLYDKLQEYLYLSASDNRVELSLNVANINYLMYNTQRETAIGLLDKLEKELIKNDMPNELITVYQALKKLHTNSPKYYYYEQLYNKHVAYYLAQNKAEDILSLFCKTLSEYYYSKSDEKKAILSLYVKEIKNINKLYTSHHLQLFLNIASIHYLLFVNSSVSFIDETIESLLKSSKDILTKNKDDRMYRHMGVVIDFLSFEYYMLYDLRENAFQNYNAVLKNSNSLFISSHTCFSYKFLLSKLKWEYIIKNGEVQSANKLEFENDNDDIPSKIIVGFYEASLFYYNGEYTKAINVLLKMNKDLSFKEYAFSEIETKLFIAFLYVLSGSRSEVDDLFRSIYRKISEESSAKMKSALLFFKLLKLIHLNKDKISEEEIADQCEVFNALNKGDYQILGFLLINEKLFKKNIRVKKIVQ